MQVILTEKVRHLGGLGDTVDVKGGYARNYLIPQKKAVMASAQNLEKFEARRAELEQKSQALLSSAQQRAAKIADTLLIIAVQASEEGKLYGSIGTHEIKVALEEKGIDVKKQEISLPNGSFHATGEYQVHIYLHSDVVATLQIQIIAQK